MNLEFFFIGLAIFCGALIILLVVLSSDSGDGEILTSNNKDYFSPNAAANAQVKLIGFLSIVFAISVLFSSAFFVRGGVKKSSQSIVEKVNQDISKNEVPLD